MVRRKIVEINEELCNGCGVCVSPCAEGAIEIIDGKARVRREELCDGAGFCIGLCPTGALTIVEREAVAFDEVAAQEHSQSAQKSVLHAPEPSCLGCGNTDSVAPLIPVRRRGRSEWVCVRCLPVLIHG